MRSFQAYPPSDANALRGEGFQLHVLRWPIRSWGHTTNINIMNCTLDPNNHLKQQHVSQHPSKQMSRCESHSAYFTKCESCFYRWLLRLRRSALWGVLAEMGDEGTGGSFANRVLPQSIDCSVTFTTEAANWKVLLLMQGQRVFNNAMQPMVLMSLGC